jgi:hypothetical protein
MTISKVLLLLIFSVATTPVSADEPTEPTESVPASDPWIDQDFPPAESGQARQERCAKVVKKARRKSLWASFLLGMASGMGNGLASTQKANVTFTDHTGRKTKSTITYVDPYQRAYLNERDSRQHADAIATLYAADLTKADCLPLTRYSAAHAR